MSIGINLTATNPFSNVRETKDLDLWLEPNFGSYNPAVDFTGFKYNGVTLEGRYAPYDGSPYSWQRSLADIKYNNISCFRYNSNPITACLRGFRPLPFAASGYMQNNRIFCTRTDEGQSITITRGSDFIQIGSDKYYAAAFRNGFVPYAIGLCLTGGGGDGHDGDLTNGGGGGGAGATIVVVLDFTKTSSFTVSIGGRKTASIVTTGTYSCTAGAGSDGGLNSGGSGGTYSNNSGAGLIFVSGNNGGSGGSQNSDGSAGWATGYIANHFQIVKSENMAGENDTGGALYNAGGGGGCSPFGKGGLGGGYGSSGDDGRGRGAGGGGGANGVFVIFSGGWGIGGQALFFY